MVIVNSKGEEKPSTGVSKYTGTLFDRNKLACGYIIDLEGPEFHDKQNFTSLSKEHFEAVIAVGSGDAYTKGLNQFVFRKVPSEPEFQLFGSVAAETVIDIQVNLNDTVQLKVNDSDCAAASTSFLIRNNAKYEVIIRNVPPDPRDSLGAHFQHFYDFLEDDTTHARLPARDRFQFKAQIELQRQLKKERQKNDNLSERVKRIPDPYLTNCRF